MENKYIYIKSILTCRLEFDDLVYYLIKMSYYVVD